jgi:hypothetical protein
MSQPGKFLSQSEKEERRLGGILFWVMNLFIFVTLYFASLISLPHPEILIVIPWLINLSFLAITFWKKPQMTIGYLLGAVLVVGIGLLLYGWFFLSCIVSLPFLITGPGILLAWAGIFLYGAYLFLVKFIWVQYQQWWTDGQYLPPKPTAKIDSVEELQRLSHVDLSEIFANYQICPKCHTDNNQNEVYCSNCGFYLRHRIQK